MNILERILKYNLCLGCGLCETLLGTDNCEMKVNEKGFYVPVINKGLSKQQERLINNCCPSIRISAENNKNKVWGNLIKIEESWSADEDIRRKSSSGGVITSLAVYLLESKQVDGILHVGRKDNSYLHNVLRISYTREDVINNCQSRYAPSLVFNQINSIFDNSNESYAFIGKPCDIDGLKNYLKQYPVFEMRIKFYLSIFCAGMPSYNATSKIIADSGIKAVPNFLQYRGNGWPGNFIVKFNNGMEYKMTYNESWGKALSRDINFRCKICPNGIGLTSDISVGDAWYTKDGYPDFTEKDGRCFTMIRNSKGKEIYDDAIDNGYIIGKNLDIKLIKTIQFSQYYRRIMMGYRILPVQIITGGLLKFKGLGIIKLALKANFIRGCRNLMGTLLRILKG